MELHRLEHIISWHSAALKLLLKVKGCESTSTRTLWLSSLSSAIPQTRPQTFCFPCPTFLIASLLSEQKAIFLSAMNHLCRSVSQFQIINWSLGRKKTKQKSKSPVLEAGRFTIITSTCRRPSRALSAVKLPAVSTPWVQTALTAAETGCGKKPQSANISHTLLPDLPCLLCQVVIAGIISPRQKCYCPGAC